MSSAPEPMTYHELMHSAYYVAATTLATLFVIAVGIAILAESLYHFIRKRWKKHDR